MLEIYELLDRFELLHPDNESISNLRRSFIDKDLTSIFKLSNTDDDLRKAIVDKNLHSIFRLVENGIDVAELRKAVIETNYHSIFRLIDNVELRKLILEENMWSLWKLLEKYTDTQFLYAFKNFYSNDIEIDKDCFSRGQIKSKLWLINELKKLDLDLGTVFLCAGWYGTLSAMLFESGIKLDKIRSFDIDPSCVNIAKIFNKPWITDNWKFQASTADIHTINYSSHTYSVSRADNTLCNLTDKPTTIINTSCEHIENFKDWYHKIPVGKLVILQGNNYFEIKEHVNCSNNLTEFSNKAPMTTVLYEGEIELSKYKRFMKIGFR